MRNSLACAGLPAPPGSGLSLNCYQNLRSVQCVFSTTERPLQDFLQQKACVPNLGKAFGFSYIQSVTKQTKIKNFNAESIPIFPEAQTGLLSH